MAYDPFTRGPLAVGVRGDEAIDTDRDGRRLPFEVWYPEDGGAGTYPLVRSSKRMFILRGADHQHFGDQIDEPGACPPEQAHLFTRTLSLAHMDAVLKEDSAAREFLADDHVAALRERGVDAAYPEAIG